MRKEDFLNSYLWDAIDNSAFNAAIKQEIISFEDLTSAGMKQLRIEAIKNAGIQEEIKPTTPVESSPPPKVPKVEILLSEQNGAISASFQMTNVEEPLRSITWTDEDDNVILEEHLGDIKSNSIKVVIVDYNNQRCSDKKLVPQIEIVAPIEISDIVTTSKKDNNLGSVSFNVFGGKSPYVIKVNDASNIIIHDAISNENHVQFSQLVAGDYTLHVTGSSSQEEIVAKFEILEENKEESFEQYIKDKVISGVISHDKVCKDLDITESELEMILYQYQKNIPVPWDDTIPDMPHGVGSYTDHWLLGVAGSGKTALLSSLIHHLRDRLLGDDIHNQRRGTNYKNYLLESKNKQCMPIPTPTNSFAYLPFNLKAKRFKNKMKRIHLIELAGEHVRKLLQETNELQRLDWIRSSNEKVISLVIEHDAGHEQEQILIQCLKLFQQRKALDKTLKIALVFTKVDTLQEFQDGASYDEMELVARRILSERFPVLKNTIEGTIDQINNSNRKGWFKSGLDIEFKVLPLTVATNLVKNSFIKSWDPEYIERYASFIESGLKAKDLKM
ncbi:MAG: hypothetical protein CL847_05615 [Crocinitomicaceae bacterium]|nr:hypothetical protein [Crocinitomicaceae bacterium]|tara:strand:+ start:7279 stop:8952 length:1674 start_codon:yes stop_codon:yes gene_type:complete